MKLLRLKVWPLTRGCTGSPKDSLKLTSADRKSVPTAGHWNTNPAKRWHKIERYQAKMGRCIGLYLNATGWWRVPDISVRPSSPLQPSPQALQNDLCRSLLYTSSRKSMSLKISELGLGVTMIALGTVVRTPKNRSGRLQEVGNTLYPSAGASE